MQNNTLIALSLASAVLSAPFIQGTLLAPGKGVHAGIIVTLESTGDKDTTDAFGKFSFGSIPSPIQTLNNPLHIAQKGLELEITGLSHPAQIDIVNSQGQILQSATSTGKNATLKLTFTQTQKLLLKIQSAGQKNVYTLNPLGGVEISSKMHSSALTPLPATDSLSFADSLGVFAGQQIASLNNPLEFVYWHRLIRGTYQGDSSKVYLHLSNSSMSYQDSATVAQGTIYCIKAPCPQPNEFSWNIWKLTDYNAYLNWGSNYNLYVTDKNISQSSSFVESDKIVVIPTFGTSSTPLSSSASSSSQITPSSSSTISSSSQISSSSLSSMSSSSVAQSSSVLISSSSITQSSSSMVPISYGSLTDARDSKVYKTVQIGTQNWMAENLNFLPDNKDQNGAWCYNNSADSCAKYGRLYNWTTMMNLADSCSYKNCSSQISYPYQGICPAGWHVASYTEWDAVNAYLGGGALTGVKMKTSEWGGDNSSGFSALPAGERDPNGGIFNYIGTQAYFGFASNSKFVFDKTCYYELNKNDSYLSQCAYSWVKSYAYSVRCIQN